MRQALYKLFLKTPLPGKGRLMPLIRNLMAPEVCRIAYGLKMELDPLEWTQISLLKNGIHEPETLRLYERILRPGDIYVDVGAHVGLHTLVARRFIGETGKVVAIEPQPYNCEKLMKNWQLNGFTNLVVFIALAGEKKGAITLQQQNPFDKSRLTLAFSPVNDTPVQFQVPMLRLDDLIREQHFDALRLIKIDTEGYENAVLEGLGNRLSCVENLVIEMLDGSGRISEKTLNILERVKGAGFELRTVKGASWKPGCPLPESNLWASKPRVIPCV